jgi:hypothetical protein
MTRDEAIALHRELEALLARGPGGIDEGVRHQLQRIEFAVRSGVEPYFRMKVGEACNYLRIWLSPRQWQQWGQDPKNFQSIVSSAVYKVYLSIGTKWPEPRWQTGPDDTPMED